MSLTNNDAYWLAGLLEGEGTFVHGPPSAPNIPRIALEMTDFDIVRRAADLMRIVSVFRGGRKNEPNRKRTFRATLKGARAVQLMLQLRPLMGDERQQDIAGALNGYEPDHVRIWESPRCVNEGCDAEAESRNLCHKHYLAFVRRNGGHAPRFSLDVLAPTLTLEDTAEARRAWLAGLLEGEGCFVVDRTGTAIVSLQMCSRNVVARAAAEMGAPSVHERNTDRTRARGWAATYETKLVSRKALALMRQLRPLMGTRRRGQIDRALEVFEARPYKRLVPAPRFCIALGRCDRQPEARGLCNKHYMRWLRGPGAFAVREPRRRRVAHLAEERSLRPAPGPPLRAPRPHPPSPTRSSVTDRSAPTSRSRRCS